MADEDVEKRKGKVAIVLLQNHMEEAGIVLKPREMARNIDNYSRDLGLQPWEVAEVSMIVLDNVFTKVMLELAIIRDKRPAKL